MFENILVCLDGSELAETILPFVAELAERLGSKVVLLSVLVMPAMFSGLGETVVEPEPSTGVPEHEAKIDYYLECTAEPLRQRGLHVECATVEGTVEESILAYAKAYEISLIALATHGCGRLGRLAFGSTTDFVLRKSGIPVLSISTANI
jgi:nucleotide-binding universal stress UspA family protein